MPITIEEILAEEWTAFFLNRTIVRGRETWSLIPTFAERRMAGGNAIALLNTPEYAEKSEQVRQIYATPDPKSM